jgi:hypothetical protein
VCARHICAKCCHATAAHKQEIVDQWAETNDLNRLDAQAVAALQAAGPAVAAAAGVAGPAAAAAAAAAARASTTAVEGAWGCSAARRSAGRGTCPSSQTTLQALPALAAPGAGTYPQQPHHTTTTHTALTALLCMFVLVSERPPHCAVTHNTHAHTTITPQLARSL